METKNALTRNKEHYLIMTCIYDALLKVEAKETFSLEDLMSHIFYDIPYEDISIFAREITIKSLSHLSEIKEIYQKNMPTWQFSRLNNLEKAILLMSYTHFKYVGDVDKAVVINTAIKLSKLYLDKDDYKFVNAILDKTL